MSLSDILQKVKAIFIIDRETGLLEYHEKIEEDGLDPNLVSGLFTAIESFANNIVMGERIESISFAKKRFVFEIIGPYLLVLHIDEDMSDEEAQKLITEVIKRYNALRGLDEAEAKSLFLDQGRSITIDLIKQIRELKNKSQREVVKEKVNEMIVLELNLPYGKKLLIKNLLTRALLTHETFYGALLMLPQEGTNGIWFYWKDTLKITSIEEFILDLIDSLNKELQVHERLHVKFTEFKGKQLVLHSFSRIKDGGVGFIVEGELEMYYFKPYLTRVVKGLEEVILRSP